MDSTRSRGRPRQVALDQRILDATLRLMGEVGYAHMSFDDIAQAAQTTRATIYLRYSSKPALAAAAIVHARRLYVLPSPTGNVRHDLTAQLRHFRESMAASYSLPIIGAALAEEHTTPELLTLVVAQLIGSYYALAIAGMPIPPDWPERTVDQVFAGIARHPDG